MCSASKTETWNVWCIARRTRQTVESRVLKQTVEGVKVITPHSGAVRTPCGHNERVQASSGLSRQDDVVGTPAFTPSVEGLYPTPHIHEQMTAHIMATSTTTLSTTR